MDATACTAVVHDSYRMQDTGQQHIGYRVIVEYRIPGTGYRIQDTAYCTGYTGYRSKFTVGYRIQHYLVPDTRYIITRMIEPTDGNP